PEGHVLPVTEFFAEGLAATRDLGWATGADTDTAVDRDFDAGYRARLEWARPQIALMAALFRLTDVAARPASLREVAAVLGESLDRTRAKIDRYARKMTQIEDGLVRLQLSFPDRPARFRVEIGDRVLHTNAGGCAGDVFALVLWTARPLRVESDCPATGRRIRVAVTPDRVTAVDPEAAVISVADPASAKFAELDRDPTSTVICRQQNFYASTEAARSDPNLEPGVRIFPVGQYLDWIRAIGVIDDPTP
ncbi:MAG: organomercurial lyase, partial [Actinoallomurus sp.]